MSYPTFKIIEKEFCPPSLQKGTRTGRWRSLFDSLPFDRAVVFSFHDRKEAYRVAKNIKGSLAQSKSVPYRIFTRCILEEDEDTLGENTSLVHLYIWKEARDDSEGAKDGSEETRGNFSVSQQRRMKYSQDAKDVPPLEEA